MATYKISDLLETLKSMHTDGFEYVSIMEIEPQEDTPGSLSIEAIVDAYSTVEDFVDAVTLPAGYSAPVE